MNRLTGKVTGLIADDSVGVAVTLPRYRPGASPVVSTMICRFLEPVTTISVLSHPATGTVATEKS